MRRIAVIFGCCSQFFSVIASAPWSRARVPASITSRGTSLGKTTGEGTYDAQSAISSSALNRDGNSNLTAARLNRLCGGEMEGLQAREPAELLRRMGGRLLFVCGEAVGKTRSSNPRSLYDLRIRCNPTPGPLSLTHPATGSNGGRALSIRTRPDGVSRRNYFSGSGRPVPSHAACPSKYDC